MMMCCVLFAPPPPPPKTLSLSAGSQGVFCEVQLTDRLRQEFLTKLGFLEIVKGEACSTEGLILGRLL